MTTIIILISHDHYSTISQIAGIFILLSKFQTNYFHNILNFFIISYLLSICFSHINKFTPQRKTSKFISPNNLNASHG